MLFKYYIIIPFVDKFSYSLFHSYLSSFLCFLFYGFDERPDSFSLVYICPQWWIMCYSVVSLFKTEFLIKPFSSSSCHIIGYQLLDICHTFLSIYGIRSYTSSALVVQNLLLVLNLLEHYSNEINSSLTYYLLISWLTVRVRREICVSLQSGSDGSYAGNSSILSSIGRANFQNSGT